MDRTDRSLRLVARGAGVLAGLVGGYHALVLLGAFGPVSCWTGYSVSDSSDGERTTAVSQGCESGIDYLFGSTEGNAPVLFFWSLALLALVALAAVAAWTGRRRTLWGVSVVGAAVTVLGAFSIGWYFLVPTLCVLAAATALSLAERRG